MTMHLQGVGGTAPLESDLAVNGAPASNAAAIFLPAKAPEAHETPADRLDHLCETAGGTYSRGRDADGVVLRFHAARGEVFVGRGSTTGEAVDALIARVQEAHR